VSRICGPVPSFIFLAFCSAGPDCAERTFFDLVLRGHSSLVCSSDRLTVGFAWVFFFCLGFSSSRLTAYLFVVPVYFLRAPPFYPTLLIVFASLSLFVSFFFLSNLLCLVVFFYFFFSSSSNFSVGCDLPVPFPLLLSPGPA